MKHLCYEIELKPGEKLILPPGLAESVGPGRWLITVEPADDANRAIRNHAAFLNGYGPRVAESGLGLIHYHGYSAPYEDVKLKAR